MTGEIRSTSRLEVAHVRLLVRAYNALQPADQATATINVTVQGRDRQAPSCVPALYVYGSGGGMPGGECSSVPRAWS